MKIVFKVLALAAGFIVVEAETSGFNTGDIVTLKNLGNNKNDARRFLDGYVMQNTIFLSPNADGHYPGTKWKIRVNPGNSVSLESLAGGGKNVWLDGRPYKSEVGLAPATDGIYSGTKWSIERVNDGYALKCLSRESANQPVWLDGNTFTGVIKLAPNTGNEWTGTHWQINRINGPNPPVNRPNPTGPFNANRGAEAKKKEEEQRRVQEAAKKIREQQEAEAKKKEFERKVQEAAKKIQQQQQAPKPNNPAPQPVNNANPPSFGNGEHITLKCNGKFLDAWLEEGRLSLSPNTDGEWTGTHWKVMTGGNGISLMNMSGDGANFLGVVNGNAGLASQRDGPEAHWAVEKQGNGRFALKGQGNRYLSCNGNVGLTGGASGDAQWEISKI